MAEFRPSFATVAVALAFVGFASGAPEEDEEEGTEGGDAGGDNYDVRFVGVPDPEADRDVGDVGSGV